ncbi:SPOSA6832_03967, partial [Sporobolomyces salmonicolor]
MSITVVTSLAQLDSLTTDQRTVSVIDFHAVWCGPCKAIAPVYQRLAAQYSGKVQFLKVDVDQAQDVARRFAVQAMPTFIVMKGSSKMKGANAAGLEQLTSLNSAIDNSQIQCLNEASEHTIRDLMKGGGDKWLESDSDEQLLLHIPVNQSIKLRALRFSTLPSSLPQAPKSIKVFVNQSSIGFDEAESQDAAHEFELTEDQAKGLEAVQLRFVRFQNVSHLTIFVASNQGDQDSTRIDKLDLIGVPIEGTADLAGLKKLDDE